MKKFLTAGFSLLLVCALTGCTVYTGPDEESSEPESSQEESLTAEDLSKAELLEAIQGNWSSEDEDLYIYDDQIEITGYYEYEGDMMPGVVTPGTIQKVKDGRFTVDLDGYVTEGCLKDPDTLVIGEREYTR